MRFARIGYNDLNSGYLEGRTGSYCKKRRFGQAFLNNYLYPMVNMVFPIKRCIVFLPNPTYTFWKPWVAALNNVLNGSMLGGSRSYVEAMLSHFENARI